MVSALMNADAERMAGREPLLEISGLAAGYRGQAVLENFDLQVFRGDRVALVGPNGCGKSTLLRTVTGVIRREQGTIRLKTSSLEGLSTEAVIKSGVGYLKQTRNIFPGLTVEDNLRLAHLDGREGSLSRRADILARFPMLEGLSERRAGLLSGGQRQALALAMVLMRRVDLLLIDEPVAGLSPDNAAALLAALDALQRAESFSFLIVEHRLRAIAPWVNRVLVMTKGRIVEDTRDTSVLTDRTRLERHYLL
jgi:ABC-type branched-subunit amino acid transport system ATPase component